METTKKYVPTVAIFICTFLMSTLIIWWPTPNLDPNKLHMSHPIPSEAFVNITNTTNTTDLQANCTSTIPEGLRRLRPKILDDFPTSFLPQFKNPCYLDRDVNFICLPHFFILGTPKSGTTDLWSKIVSHPHIVNELIKEPHWWARYSKRRGVSSYGMPFGKAIREDIQKHHFNEIIAGDGSASTLWDIRDWTTLYPDHADDGPPYMIADVIRTVLPKAKLIVIFREPSERLYSDYRYFYHSPTHKGMITPIEFHSAVAQSVEKFDNCTRSGRSERACSYNHDTYHDRALIGLYSVHVRDWLERFPRDQMMFLELGEWQNSCTRLLPELYEFLGVQSLRAQTVWGICSMKKQNSNRQHGPMLNKTREMLREFYRPFVMDLADILEDEKFRWDYEI